MPLLLLSSNSPAPHDAVNDPGQDQTTQSYEAQEEADTGCVHGNRLSSCRMGQALKRLLRALQEPDGKG